MSAVPDLEMHQDGATVTVQSNAGKANTLNQHFVQQTRLENLPTGFPDLPPTSDLSPDSFFYHSS